MLSPTNVWMGFAGVIYLVAALDVAFEVEERRFSTAWILLIRGEGEATTEKGAGVRVERCQPSQH